MEEEGDVNFLTGGALVVKTRAFDEQEPTKNILSINTAKSQVGFCSLGLQATELDLPVLVRFDNPLHPC